MVYAVGCALGAQCLMDEPSRTSETLTRVVHYILEISIENPRATLHNKTLYCKRLSVSPQTSW